MSSIEWTDTTWNIVTGCTKVSPGCANCYAEAIAHRFWGHRAFEEVEVHPHRLFQPLHWRKPRKVFVNSMSDLFHEKVSDAYLDKVFAIMAIAHHHTFQILTKRPQRMKAYLSDPERGEVIRQAASQLGYPLHFPYPLKNVWMGVSVESQPQTQRIPDLLEAPVHHRFVSCEPLLSELDLTPYLRPIYNCGQVVEDGTCGHGDNLTPECHDQACPLRWDWTREGLDWIIIGGESGPKARPCNLDWIRALIEQGEAFGVPVFVKQLGRRAVSSSSMLVNMANGKGNVMSDWPEDLQVREFPSPESK
ncbi:phage Gp37/Gp68 family protein [Spirulina sp. CS-785/01]|uniref:DUF5131 family protein n=1 Tax=Spirulina sp. CS-785/01 TaxID=3021716 RepID=UPI00232B120B|nr:phage Gp37/Gp68 family protein [Spirulina sp. CS-785/01]MDB9315631.1 phage Gp37/Gp68 family protein [Spirulina sp. CS-785/01]